MKVPRFPIPHEHGRPRFWLLDENHQPYEATDRLEWALALEECRHIAVTEIGDVAVSTVFLGVDHRSSLVEGPPILFETMIFGGKLNDYQVRYESYAEAVAGHAAAVELVHAANRQAEREG